MNDKERQEMVLIEEGEEVDTIGSLCICYFLVIR